MDLLKIARKLRNSLMLCRMHTSVPCAEACPGGFLICSAFVPVAMQQFPATGAALISHCQCDAPCVWGACLAKCTCITASRPSSFSLSCVWEWCMAAPVERPKPAWPFILELLAFPTHLACHPPSRPLGLKQAKSNEVCPGQVSAQHAERLSVRHQQEAATLLCCRTTELWQQQVIEHRRP